MEKMFKNCYIICLLLIGASIQAQELQRYTEEEVTFQDKFIEAKGYILIDRADKAEKILIDLYKEDRSNAAVALELSYLYEKLDDPFNQHRYAKIAADNSEGNIHILKKYAEVCMATAKYDEAINACKSLVKKSPNSEEYTDMLALAYIKSDDHKAAIKAYQNLEDRIGVVLELSRRKFELYDLLNNKAAAVNELKKLVAAQPSNLEALHNLAAYYNKIGKEKDAKEIYKQILKVDINDTKANIALMSSSDSKENDSNYLRALAPIIDNANVPIDNKVLELIPYVQKMGKSQDANLKAALIELSDRLVANHTNEAKAHAIKGDILLLADRPSDAIKSYEKTLSINDNVYQVWEQLLYAYSAVGKYSVMSQKAEEAIDLFPNKPSAYYLYGLSNNKLGNYADAISYLEEGVLVSGKDTYHKSNILAQLAYGYHKTGEAIKADATIDKSVTISEYKNPIALEIKGDITADLGNKKEAIKYWKQALDLGSNSKSLSDKISKNK